MNPFTEKSIRNYLRTNKQLLVTQDLHDIHTVHRFEDAEEAIKAIGQMGGEKTIFLNK